MFIPREAGLRSPLAQVTATVIVSLLVHGLYYLLVDGLFCRSTVLPCLPCLNIEYVFSFLHVMENEPVGLGELSKNFSDFRWNILSYIFLTGALGAGLGTLIAQGIIHKKLNFKKIVQHDWVYDLIVTPKETVKFAYVLTRIQNKENVIMYKGTVKYFFASADGELIYLVLSEATRYFMKLDGESPKTTDHVNIGESAKQVIKDADPGADGKNTKNNLLIEGADISNVYFEIIKLPIDDDIDIDEIVKSRAQDKPVRATAAHEAE